MAGSGTGVRPEYAGSRAYTSPDMTAHLRRAFKFPTDDSPTSSTQPEYMDEQEQEHLLTSLSESDAASNTLYKRIFLALLTVITILYTLSLPPLILTTTATIPVRVLTLLSSVISLAIIYDIPTQPSISGHGRPAIRRSVTDYGIALMLLPSSGPPHDRLMRKAVEGVRKWLVLANATLCGCMVLYAFWRLKDGEAGASPQVTGISEREGMSIRMFVSPCVVAMALAMVARYELRPVDIDALRKLRYNYKGA